MTVKEELKAIVGNDYQEKIKKSKSIRVFGRHKVEDMDREDLLFCIGYLMDEIKDRERFLLFMKSIKENDKTDCSNDSDFTHAELKEFQQKVDKWLKK